mgnify:CR=1 FL=1
MLLTVGAMVLTIAAVIILRNAVPQAIGRILPFGFFSGINLALAYALSVAGVTLLRARSKRAPVSALVVVGSYRAVE